MADRKSQLFSIFSQGVHNEAIVTFRRDGEGALNQVKNSDFKTQLTNLNQTPRTASISINFEKLFEAP